MTPPTTAQARQLIRDVATLGDPTVTAFGLGGAFGSMSDPGVPSEGIQGNTYVDFGEVAGTLTYRACYFVTAPRKHSSNPAISIGSVTRWQSAQIEGLTYAVDLPSLREAVAVARMPQHALPRLGDIVKYRDLEGPCALDEAARFCINLEPVEFWRFMIESGRLSEDPLLRGAS